MDNIIAEFQNIQYAMSYTWPFAAKLLALLWGINILNHFLQNRLLILGIYPRTIHGLIGIPFSPFLHGSFNHLFFNSIPLFFLTNFILFEGQERFYTVSAYIICMSGTAIWFFGRRAFHIGASSVIMGYWAYLPTHAYYQGTGSTIMLALITLYYFGGLFLNVFPSGPAISWEGHIFGAIAGVIAAFL